VSLNSNRSVITGFHILSCCLRAETRTSAAGHHTERLLQPVRCGRKFNRRRQAGACVGAKVFLSYVNIPDYKLTDVIIVADFRIVLLLFSVPKTYDRKE